MADFSIKQNDTLPALIVDPKNEDGSAMDLSDVVSVQFFMRSTAGQLKVNRSATAANGVLSYSWSTGDTDIVGSFEAEFQCTTDSGVFTVPTVGYITVEIIDDIG